jgi:putative Ca2+/H+ antiporter (TMEM165/GDT1 family)
MDPVVFGSAFSLIFLAEMGDKSQLIAMTLAHRYRPVPVVAGVFTAFAMLNLLAV